MPVTTDVIIIRWSLNCRNIISVLVSCDVQPSLFPGVELCCPDVVMERTIMFSSHRVFCQMDVGFVSLISVVFVLVVYRLYNITSYHMVKTDAGLTGLYIREITIYIRLYYYINS